MHVHRVSQWKNEDAAGVLAFWTEVLALDWVDGKQITERLALHLSEINAGNSALLAPLLANLLNMPRQEHSLLGRAVARCVTAGAVDDVLLWGYVAGDISDDDALEFRFGKKLRCKPHEFGDRHEKFLLQRIEQSSELLDLAIQSVEQWSLARISGKGPWMAGRIGFLSSTSYNAAHSQHGLRHIDSEHILLDAMEAAILQHAKTHSNWWQINRERLCFSHEGALRYFAILACTMSPEANIDLIGRMLRDKDLLESDLSFELGTLMQAAFMSLDAPVQDAVMATILSMREEMIADERHRFWILQKRAELIVTIPCHHRSPEAQAVLDAYENTAGTLIRQPDIGTRGGTVHAPFSFEVFLGTSDSGVLLLLAHYAGHESNFDEFLIGGEREVGWQLREAASRHPTRFLHLLPEHWADISKSFRNDIMDGVANYLAHRYDNLQANVTWTPIDEPDAPTLARQVLDELERHPNHWNLNSAASNALQACAHVIYNPQEAAQLVFVAIGFENLREESFISGDSVDLLTTGINMVRGHVAEALMILTNHLQEKSVQFPELLLPTLRRFAGDECPAIRALILRRLPYLQSHNPELGWDLFHIALQGDATGLWETAELCLYYVYQDHFEKAAPFLAHLHSEGSGKDLETWGRISALAALTKRIDFSVWLEDLKALDVTDAWSGAATVWTHPENLKQHRKQCLAGIEAGLNANKRHAAAVAQQTEHLFRCDTLVIPVSIEVIRLCFAVFESDSENKHHHHSDFDEWLNATAHRDPEQALAATEVYLAYVSRTKPYLYDHGNNLTQLLTRLFAEAEEREESDHGGMLKRVVAIQDALLGFGVDGINSWLKAAERP
jgi:hypothetical protein